MPSEVRTPHRDYYAQTVRIKHWSRESQSIAPADILINRLQRGWSLDPVVRLEAHIYGPGRVVNIYHFTLRLDDEVLELPVQSNPVVRRLIDERKLKVTSLPSTVAANR
jgi:hypothetical protein